MTYQDLQQSLQIFNLPARATLKEIKGAHRHLVKRYHPDSGEEHDPEQIRRINAAYKVLLDFVSDYHFSFTEDEFYAQNPDERLRRQFAYDPVWGSKSEE